MTSSMGGLGSAQNNRTEHNSSVIECILRFKRKQWLWSTTVQKEITITELSDSTHAGETLLNSFKSWYSFI